MQTEVALAKICLKNEGKFLRRNCEPDGSSRTEASVTHGRITSADGFVSDAVPNRMKSRRFPRDLRMGQPRMTFFREPGVGNYRDVEIFPRGREGVLRRGLSRKKLPVPGGRVPPRLQERKCHFLGGKAAAGAVTANDSLGAESAGGARSPASEILSEIKLLHQNFYKAILRWQSRKCIKIRGRKRVWGMGGGGEVSPSVMVHRDDVSPLGRSSEGKRRRREGPKVPLGSLRCRLVSGACRKRSLLLFRRVRMKIRSRGTLNFEVWRDLLNGFFHISFIHAENLTLMNFVLFQVRVDYAVRATLQTTNRFTVQ